jgi:hypothetical protein
LAFAEGENSVTDQYDIRKEVHGEAFGPTTTRPRLNIRIDAVKFNRAMAQLSGNLEEMRRSIDRAFLVPAYLLEEKRRASRKDAGFGNVAFRGPRRTGVLRHSIGGRA